MATPFRLKRSAISGKRPTLNDLQLGELALNTYDAYLYGTRDAGGVGIGTTVTLLTPWTENFGAASIYYQNVVGVGTTNPTSKFTVQGDVLITGFSTVRSNFTVAGVTTTRHLNVIGFTTVVNQSITGVATVGSNLAVAGVTTSQHLNITGFTTVVNQSITGVLTVTNGIQGIGIQSAGSNIATGLITAINFVGAGNSFSYNSGTKTVDINIGGSQWTFVDPGNPTTSSIYRVNGNVGIGTTNPLSKFDLVGDGKFTGVVTATTFIGNINSGVGTVTTLNVTTANLTNANILSGIVTTLSGTNINYSGVGTIARLNSTNANLTNINSSGITTLGIVTAVTSINFASGGVLGDPYGDGGFGLKSAPNQYATIASNNLQQYIQVDNTTTYIGTGYGSTTGTYDWQFKKDGSTQFPNGLILAPPGQNITLQSDQYSQLFWMNADQTVGPDKFTNVDFFVASGYAILDIGYRDGASNQQYKSWSWSLNGLQFPDLTIQDTAFTGYAPTAGIATALQYQRTFEITGDVVASPIFFDGTGNVSLAATIQPNSVGLGTDTTGDYVRDITGTSNQITVTGGTGEGSTPTLSIPNQFTVPQDLTVTRDVQINRNLNVTGNITIGGTSATLFTTELKVSDPDLILGFRTDAFGNDISNDTTANHGGISVASTEGTPLVSLYNPGIGESTLPTYKKIMWFKTGSFAGLGTDAWLINYAVGIGSTQFPTGTRLAAGNVQFTQNDLAVVRNINASGIITAATGNLTTANLTNANILSGIVTTLSGTNLNYSGVGTVTTLNVTTANISTGNILSGIVTTLSGTNINYSGVGTIATLNSTTANITTANITTGNILSGIVTTLSGTNINYSGVGTIATLNSTSANLTNINSSGITTVGFLTATNISVSGIVTSNGYYIAGTQVISSARQLQNIASLDAITTATIEAAIANAPNTFTDLTVTGISTLGVTSATDLTAQQLNITGVSTISVNSSSDALRITQEGSGNALVVEDSTNPDATPFVVTASGNVGIGTTISTAKLKVVATGNTFSDVNISNSNNGASVYTQLALSNDSSTLVLQNNASSRTVSRLGGTIGGWGELYLTSGNGIRVGTSNASPLVLGTNNTEALRIDSSQRVGIGTTNPTAKLNVVDNSSSDALRITQEGSGNALVVEDSTNPDATPFVVNAAGSVGIGTTNPGSTLTVQGDTNVSGVVTAIGGFNIGIQSGGINITTGVVTSFNFIGAGNTFAYNAGTKTVDINIGGSQWTFVDSSNPTTSSIYRVNGNVGIGTTNPTSKLHVVGDTLITGITTTNSLNIGATQVISSARQLQNIASLDATTTATIEAAIQNAPNTFTDLQVTGISTFTNGPVLIGSGTSTGTASQPLQVSGGAYVSGSVGIGTTNPITTLQVFGGVTSAGGELNLAVTSSNVITIPSTISSASSFGTLQIFGGGMASPSSRGGQIDFVAGLATTNPGSLIFRTGIATGGTSQPEVARFSSSGNLGIGTTNPTAALTIATVGSATTGASQIYLNGATSNRIDFNTNGVAVPAAGRSSGTKIVLFPSLTGGIEYAIGVEPSHIWQSVPAGSIAGFKWYSGTTELAVLKGNGNLGIGTTNPTSTLTVQGNAYITGVTTSTDFDSLSDINLKTNINQIADPLEKVMQIRGVTFDWKESNRGSAGVIAQEIEQVLPELVHGGETKTVNYNGLIGLLIECVKKQQEEIEQLKKLN